MREGNCRDQDFSCAAGAMIWKSLEGGGCGGKLFYTKVASRIFSSSLLLLPLPCLFLGHDFFDSRCEVYALLELLARGPDFFVTDGDVAVG